MSVADTNGHVVADDPMNEVDRILDTPRASTWSPISLEAILNGEQVDPEPTMLARADGRCLLYPERVHALHAEPEALKSWLALKACAERLDAGHVTLYIDCEDSAASIVQRLQALCVSATSILEYFIYVRPDEPLAAGALDDLDRALERQPALAIVDGVTEAFSRQGLSPLDNSDVAKWLDLLPRRLVRAGAAVLLLDHVVKDKESRGRYALGAQHKLAGCDVAYSLRVVEPFGHGREGQVAIKVEKDRPGRVREFASESHVALLRARSESGMVTLTLEPPEKPKEAFRPTGLMERVSIAVETNPGLSKRALRDAVGGRANYVDLALELLVAEGFIEARPEGKSHQHHPLRPYREATDTGPCPSVSKPCPGPGESDRVPCPDPLGEGRGHGLSEVPAEDSTVSRLSGHWTDDELQALIDSEEPEDG